MPAAPAVRSAEMRYRHLEHAGQFLRQLAFTCTRTGYGDRSENSRFEREIVDMPSQGFLFLSVTFEAGGQIPLGASHIEVHAGLQHDAPEATCANAPGPGQMKDRDINAAVHASCAMPYNS